MFEMKPRNAFSFILFSYGLFSDKHKLWLGSKLETIERNALKAKIKEKLFVIHVVVRTHHAIQFRFVLNVFFNLKRTAVLGSFFD